MFHDHYSIIYIEYDFVLNYDYDGVFSHILIEWNNISDLTPFLQKNNKCVLVRGRGGGSWSSASGKGRWKKPYFYHAAVLALRGKCKCEGFDAANGIDFYYLFSGELTIRMFPQAFPT